MAELLAGLPFCLILRTRLAGSLSEYLVLLYTPGDLPLDRGEPFFAEFLPLLPGYGRNPLAVSGVLALARAAFLFGVCNLCKKTYSNYTSFLMK